MMMRKFGIKTAVLDEKDSSREIYGPCVERNGDGIELYLDGDFINNLVVYGKRCREYAGKIAESTESRRTNDKKRDEEGEILRKLTEEFCKMIISGLPTNSRIELLVEIGEKKSEIKPDEQIFERPVLNKSDLDGSK